MADQKTCCACAHCRMSGLMWPVILITLGALFLIGEYSGRYTFGQLWPVILIVIGLMKILESTASTEGHTGSREQSQSGSNPG